MEHMPKTKEHPTRFQTLSKQGWNPMLHVLEKQNGKPINKIVYNQRKCNWELIQMFREIMNWGPHLWLWGNRCKEEHVIESIAF